MKRMVTAEEIIDLIKEHGATPEQIAEIVEELVTGHYVQVIDAPESTTLTEEEFERVKEGVFVNGNFLGLQNPVFYPAQKTGETTWKGIIMGTDTGAYHTFYVREYLVNSSRVISFTSEGSISLAIGTNAGGPSTLGNSGKTFRAWLNTINNKALPNYPANTGRFTYKFINGTLTWQEGNGLYLHSVVFDVSMGQSFTIRLISDSPDTCAVDSVSGNFTIPNATFIQPANMGHVVIRPFNETQFYPDIYAFDNTAGTFSDLITLASVTSDTVTPIG